jgi:hypothetical protein
MAAAAAVVRFECQGGVTLRTAHEAMQAKQREFAEIMIELKLAPPSLLSVALLACLAKLAGMWIFGAMTVHAALAELLRRRNGAVAGVTIELGVRALQVEVVPACVIQTRYAPPFIVVAVAAFRAEAGRVRVVGTVAAIAVLRNFFLVVAAAMTGGAADPVMRAEQIEAGFLEVIEFRGFPFLGGMAFRAGIAACAAMLIVGSVTTDAALRSLFVDTADVAGVASQAAMRAAQAKVR